MGFLPWLDVVIGGYGSGYAGNSSGGISTYAASGDTNLFGTFAELFKSGFDLISDNPALLAIIAVAVGIPILGSVIAIFRGR